MSIETLKDLADSTSAPVTGNVTILPSKMIGDFQMESSERFDEFMYEMGVNMFTRTIVNQLYPLQKIRQDPADELITIETLTSFKNTKIEFKLGETWEEYTADGQYTQTTVTVEGQPGEVSSPQPAHHVRDPAVQGGRQGDASPPCHHCQARYHLQESLQTSSGRQGGGAI